MSSSDQLSVVIEEDSDDVLCEKARIISLKRILNAKKTSRKAREKWLKKLDEAKGDLTAQEILEHKLEKRGRKLRNSLAKKSCLSLQVYELYIQYEELKRKCDKLSLQLDSAKFDIAAPKDIIIRALSEEKWKAYLEYQDVNSQIKKLRRLMHLRSTRERQKLTQKYQEYENEKELDRQDKLKVIRKKIQRETTPTLQPGTEIAEALKAITAKMKTRANSEYLLGEDAFYADTTLLEPSWLANRGCQQKLLSRKLEKYRKVLVVTRNKRLRELAIHLRECGSNTDFFRAEDELELTGSLKELLAKSSRALETRKSRYMGRVKIASLTVEVFRELIKKFLETKLPAFTFSKRLEKVMCDISSERSTPLEEKVAQAKEAVSLLSDLVLDFFDSKIYY